MEIILRSRLRSHLLLHSRHNRYFRLPIHLPIHHYLSQLADLLLPQKQKRARLPEQVLTPI